MSFLKSLRSWIPFWQEELEVVKNTRTILEAYILSEDPDREMVKDATEICRNLPLYNKYLKEYGKSLNNPRMHIDQRSNRFHLMNCINEILVSAQQKYKIPDKNS